MRSVQFVNCSPHGCGGWILCRSVRGTHLSLSDDPRPAWSYAHGMDFTPLHRALGRQPSDLTNELLDEAVTQGVAETDDLDWKKAFPTTKLAHSDVPKDIAAMANRGGGMIIYGVDEDQRKATERVTVTDFGENEERTYRSVAVTAITPPVFGLDIRRLGGDPAAVAVIVPASVDGPHLIYKNDYFGAPIRNDADTVWMKERQIEAMYKARFDERRRSDEAMEALYTETVAGRDTDKRAWLIAVARPRIPGVLKRMSVEDALEVRERAGRLALTYSEREGAHPLEHLTHSSPRTGLRRWVLPNTAGGSSSWREAWAEMHFDGSVALAAALGGHRSGVRGETLKGNEVESRGIECAVVDFLSLVRAVGEKRGHGEYEVRVGIEITADTHLKVYPYDPFYQGVLDSPSAQMASYTPVLSSVNAAASDEDFHRQLFQVAEDCVNQGGVSHLVVIHPAPESDDEQ